MVQPEPPQFIIIGIQQVMEEVKKVVQNQQDLVTRLDIHITEQILRTHNLERDVDAHDKAIAQIKERTVTRPAMWVGVGVLVAAAGVFTSVIAIVVNIK